MRDSESPPKRRITKPNRPIQKPTEIQANNIVNRTINPCSTSLPPWYGSTETITYTPRPVCPTTNKARHSRRSCAWTRQLGRLAGGWRPGADEGADSFINHRHSRYSLFPVAGRPAVRGLAAGETVGATHSWQRPWVPDSAGSGRPPPALGPAKTAPASSPGQSPPDRSAPEAILVPKWAGSHYFASGRMLFSGGRR